MKGALQNAASLATALGAAWSSSQLGAIAKSIARKVARIVRSKDDTDCVISVRKIPANEWVYDLTVGKGHLPEFYANGILTHNSSDGEVRCFFDYISAMQQSLFKDRLETLLNFVQLSLYGEIDPEITFEFVPLWQMNEKEKAEVEKLKADTAQVLIDVGVISPQEERQRVADDPESQYTSLDVDDMPNLLDEEMNGLVEKGEGGEGQLLADRPKITGAQDSAETLQD
jgi:hypothetical protein